MPSPRQCSFAPPSVLPDISPSRGEIGSFVRTTCPSWWKIGEGANDGVISPLEGEMSGRTEGGNLGLSAGQNEGCPPC